MRRISHSNRQKLPLSTTPLSFDAPAKRNLHKLESLAYVFVADSMGLSSFKFVCDFLLVHVGHGPILHRFWDTATYWLKIAYFSYPSHSAPSLLMFSLEFRVEVNQEETRIMGLSSSKDRKIVACVILTQCQRVTDGLTDGRTDLLLLVQCSA